MDYGDWKEWGRHVLAELKRIDEKCDKTFDKVGDVDKKVDRLEMAQDQQEAHMSSFHTEHKRMNDILDANTDSLKEHMRRTDLNENKIDVQEARYIDLEARFQPIEKKYNEKQIIMKFLTSRWGKITMVLGAISAIVGFIAKLKF